VKQSSIGQKPISIYSLSRGVKMVNYLKVCFVIMPFGKKKVGNKEVDFDYIYDIIFKPAISEVVLPEGREARTETDRQGLLCR
jgi:hypothetical protein